MSKAVLFKLSNKYCVVCGCGRIAPAVVIPSARLHLDSWLGSSGHGRFRPKTSGAANARKTLRKAVVMPSAGELTGRNKSGKLFLRMKPGVMVKSDFRDFDDYLDVQYQLMRADFISPLQKAFRSLLALQQNTDQEGAGISGRIPPKGHGKEASDGGASPQKSGISKDSVEDGGFLGEILGEDLVETDREADSGKATDDPGGSLASLPTLMPPVKIHQDYGGISFFKTVTIDRCRIHRKGPLVHSIFLDQSNVSDFELDGFFMSGSLVCFFPKGNISDIFIGVVADRTNFVNNFYIDVAFERSVSEKIDAVRPPRSMEYSMIESLAFFRPYQAVMAGIKAHSERGHFVFSDYLIKKNVVPKPPAYIKPGQYEFKFGPILADPTRIHNCDILDMRKWPTSDDLGMEESQVTALKMALTNELSVIQGPPGTGKTSLGVRIARFLLANQPAFVWSPIVVISYKNHSLDNFLEQLLDFQPQGIIRLGGQSQSERLKPFNLKEVRQRYTANKMIPSNLTHQLRLSYSSVQATRKEVSEWNQKLKIANQLKFLGIQKLQKFMQPKHIKQFAKISRILTDRVVGSNSEFKSDEHDVPLERDPLAWWLADLNPKELQITMENLNTPSDPTNSISQNLDLISAKKKLANLNDSIATFFNCDHGEVKSVAPMAEMEVMNTPKLMTIDPLDRLRLYAYWREKYLTDLESWRSVLLRRYAAVLEQAKEAMFATHAFVLKTAAVIGMTTTGAASWQKILDEIQPKIVIVEEAAEVLESHVLVSINSNCEHVILIGDHMQLQPHVVSEKISNKYGYSMSMFERLINCGCPHAMLTTQHRMRPEIANALMPHFYNNLTNHRSVCEYPEVRGMPPGSFLFISHIQLDCRMGDFKSFANPFEAEYCVALCRYLISQNYAAGDITIIASYTAQVMLIKELIGKLVGNHQPLISNSGFGGDWRQKMSEVDVVTVDGFQGRQSNIVLLSLVRSNAQNRIGFLELKNRVCVALSRAKIGFYCFGNFATLARVAKAPFWADIIKSVNQSGFLVEKFSVTSPSGSDLESVVIAEPGDFDVFFDDSSSDRKKFRNSEQRRKSAFVFSKLQRVLAEPNVDASSFEKSRYDGGK